MSRLWRVAAGAGLALAALVQLVPFYVALTTSLKPRTDLSSQWVLPTSGIYLENFRIAVEDGGILRAIGSSAIITVASTALICVLGALAAYPLARRDTLGNRIVFAGIIGLIMIPPLSILVPVYTLMVQLGGINT
ncbi:MAG: carbohydrate ABC transporter permease [Microbacteriaceae bacterium]|nr:carbohydrate ABC transporter permease [Microbacteriaceae bacterium]